ncbi:MAG: APC family permease [Sphingomicrobium sp.]
MGTWGAVFLSLNGMIGAAIFGLPGKLDAAVGPFAPWLLLIAGGGVMLIALCYADLATRFESTGGSQLYAGAAFGRFVGFQTGWLIYASRAAALGANATVLSAYAGALWPPLDGPATIIVTVGAITIINIVGLKRAIDVLGGLTLLKLLPLLLLVLLGLGTMFPMAAPALPRFDAVEGIALAALYAFVGFEAATVPAGETRDPKRAIPIALLASVAGVTLLYVFVQLVYSAAGVGQSDAPLAALAEMQIGPVGTTLLGLTAIVSVLANQLSLVTSTSRLTYGMAEQGLLPRWFAYVSPRYATPSASIATLGALGLALALSGSFIFLAVVSSLARLFAYLACVAAVPRLDAIAGRVRWGRGVLLPVVAGSLCLWAAAQSKPDEWLTFGAFIVAGTILYALAARVRAGNEPE